jgi:hypothetical protein
MLRIDGGLSVRIYGFPYFRVSPVIWQQRGYFCHVGWFSAARSMFCHPKHPRH